MWKVFWEIGIMIDGEVYRVDQDQTYDKRGLECILSGGLEWLWIPCYQWWDAVLLQSRRWRHTVCEDSGFLWKTDWIVLWDERYILQITREIEYIELIMMRKRRSLRLLSRFLELIMSTVWIQDWDCRWVVSYLLLFNSNLFIYIIWGIIKSFEVG
jgi:hypothetical protein